MLLNYRIGTKKDLPALMQLAIKAWSQYANLLTEEMIAIAERFILENGYTKLPGDSNKLSYELFDNFAPNKRSILEFRHNSLHPHAYYIQEHREECYIGFLSTEIDTTKLYIISKDSNLEGRGVAVFKKSKKARMLYKTPLFSKWRRVTHANN